jgi:hypothetical protein
VSSLVATALVTAGGFILSKRTRQWLVALLLKFTGLGIQRIYPQQKLANFGIPTELSKARWVKVLAGRGNELTRDGFTSVWGNTDNHLESVQILLPNPDLGSDSWLARREENIRSVDPGIRPGLLAEQVRTNSSYLLEVARQKENVTLRFYDLPNIYRVILTDNVAYLTIYRNATHGRNSPCIVARRPGLMYDLALLLFSTAWEHSLPAEDAVCA